MQLDLPTYPKIWRHMRILSNSTHVFWSIEYCHKAIKNFVSRKCTKLQKLFQWKCLTWYQCLCVIFAPTNPENLKWEFILFNLTTIMSQNFGKFANFVPDITQPIWSSKIIFVYFNPEFVGCVVKTLIQNQINICINICDLNIWILLRYEKITIY